MSTQLQQLVIKGKVLTAGDAEYDNARKVWNGMIDRKPAFIAQCTNADDISECVRFARKNNMIVSVKGGGHNVAGQCRLRWRTDDRSFKNERDKSGCCK
jgi:FAD/FMN-containing dehydrogenase